MTNGQTPSDQPRQYSDFYREVGEETFAKIVRGFYARVPDDDILGPMYPDDDWEGAERRLRMFLEQYWGGPDTYNAERGHPRLRMRHHPFVVDMAARDRWLELMALSLADVSDDELPKPHRDAMWEHMVRVADMLINKPA
ncbi:globin [Corynebacterium xerosis]|uniref:Globin n=1 Tax=Corynebacterium xerosis TaxID=1725 RepID=A0A494RUN7_9CORY|nr:globin [Corynebacterium xerosis]AYJ32883.1 globin [Corynebacterium xerosis]NMF10365.1 globin [Corynebacterium xerosis]HJG56191.1 globin [Corynebacterium xerosis]